MTDDLVKRARHNAKADMPHYASAELIEALADRIEELDAKVWPNGDYKQTRDAAGIITSRYSEMLKRLGDDYEADMVVISLMKHYNLCLDNDDTSILEAIERVLEDYLRTADYNAWMLSLKDKVGK